ncbi:MAG: hypothetical protein WDO19_17325 [Bacteroidota bacterium]
MNYDTVLILKNPGKSWKIALGIKVGTLLNAHTKGKNMAEQPGADIDQLYPERKQQTLL